MGDRGRRFNLGSQTKFWYTSTEAGLEYRKVNREVRRKMKAEKEEWTEKQWKSIEKGMMLGTNPQGFHQGPAA